MAHYSPSHQEDIEMKQEMGSHLEFDPTFDGLFSKAEIVQSLVLQSGYDAKMNQPDEDNDISKVGKVVG